MEHFLENVAASVGPAARWIHQGLTSSDILDTTLGVQMSESVRIIIKDVGDLRGVIAEQARKYKMTPLIKARAKGEPHREPTSTPATPPSAPAKPARGSGGNAQPDGGGRNPLPLIGAALGAGVATAKLLDWRGHAHPRA